MKDFGRSCSLFMFNSNLLTEGLEDKGWGEEGLYLPSCINKIKKTNSQNPSSVSGWLLGDSLGLDKCGPGLDIDKLADLSPCSLRC